MLDTMYMGTTLRHNELGFAFNANLWKYIKSKEITTLQENVALVHYGRKGRGEICKLINISDFTREQTEEFRSGLINDLETIQPDFCVFYNNQYIVNDRGTKIAGTPDLIVEIWSESNTDIEKAVKRAIYSESNTQHWYITQDSNKIECMNGTLMDVTRDLRDILVDNHGFEYDLRYLAL